jgi:hypothetical protein
MIARTAKNLLRNRLRHCLRNPEYQRPQDVVATLLNLVLGSDPASEEFWDTEMRYVSVFKFMYTEGQVGPKTQGRTLVSISIGYTTSITICYNGSNRYRRTT